MTIPRGKGMYIWQPDRLCSPEFVAQKAQEVGLASKFTVESDVTRAVA